MIIVCEHCGKKGTLDEQPYSGKKLKLRCPYCSHDFIHTVPINGDHPGAVVVEAVTVPETTAAAKEPEPPPPPSPPPPRPAPTPTPSPVVQEASEAIVLEAKRIARLIISEIKLYNQDKIAKAASRREILALLKNDLIRGKQHYDGRIASKLPAGPDYFMETVKEILLAGKN